MWSLCSFTLSDGEDFSEVVGWGSSSSSKSTELGLKRWQIKTEGSFSVIHTVFFFYRQFVNTTPQCQWQTHSLVLHFTLPWILFLASEEGSRCKITGLPESNSLGLELRLLPCEMKCCTPLGRRLGALWWSSWGYLTLSKAGFVLCCLYLQPVSIPSLFCHKHLACVRHCCPGNRENISPCRDVKRVTGRRNTVSNVKLAYKVTFTAWRMNWLQFTRGFWLKC